MRIYLNPGHDIKYDPGACGNGLQEAQVALSVGELVKKYLEAIGYEVRMLQSDNLYYDTNYSDRPTAVVADANNWDADLFVSIHCNAASNPAALGTECLFYPGSTKSMLLSQMVQLQLIASLDTVDRGIKERANLVVLKRTDMPATLVEIGFISNPDDAAILRDRQDDIARAIARGITDYVLGRSTADQIPTNDEPATEEQPTPTPTEDPRTQDLISPDPTRVDETPAPSSHKVMDNDELAKWIATTLIETGVEGGYDAVSCSTAGDYPSIGCSQWEGDRADDLLERIPGGSKFADTPYSVLDRQGLLGELSELLDSPEGQKAQLEKLAEDCRWYVDTLQQIPGFDDTRCMIYAGAWCPTSTSCVKTFISNRAHRFDIHSLKALNDIFDDEYAYAVGCGEYAAGYSNRAHNTYQYVASIDLTTDYGIPEYGKGIYGR